MDVKDRLFRDSDGLWKVERKLKEVVFTGNEGWAESGMSTNTQQAVNVPISDLELGSTKGYLFSHGQDFLNGSGFQYNTNNRHFFRIDKKVTPDYQSFISFMKSEYIRGYPLTLVAVLETPITETLPTELQDKLNNITSFKDSNYVYTLFPDGEGGYY